MLKYQYNERKYAKELLENGFTTNYIKHELQILVKYYKDLDYKPKEREEAIYKFCEEHLEDYNRVTHFKMINSVLNYGRKKENKIVEIDGIPITRNEIDFIDGLDIEHNYKKVLFTLIVLNKLNKTVQSIRTGEVNDEYYFGGNARFYKQLREVSKIPVYRSRKKKDIHGIIGDLADLGLVEIRGRGYIKLLFMYEIESESETVIDVKTYDNIGYYFDYYKGENKVKECEECGILHKARSNKNKYCKECSEEVWREYNAKKQKEYRQKQKRV